MEKLLSRDALSLLLRLMESPEANISGNVLFGNFRLVAEDLLEGHWLRPNGVVTHLDMDDGFADLEWYQESRGYRHFSVDAGWVEVEPSRLKRFSVDMEHFLYWMGRLLDIGSGHCLTALVDNVLWHLGATRIGKYRVNFYFVRRLLESDNQRPVVRAIKRESSRTPAIVLNASTQAPPLLELPLDVALVPLENVLSRTGRLCVLDVGAAASILQGARQTESKDESGIGLRFSTDYRQVHWNGKTYKLTKKQAAVFEALDREGGRAHKDLLRAEADTNEELHRIMRNKVDGKWVYHPLWKTLLKGEGNGYYYLDDGVATKY